MNEPIPRKPVLLKPCIPLVDTTPIDVDKTQLVTYSLKIRPGGANDHTYKKTVRLFAEGSVTEWIETIRDIHEIWKQNSINGAHDCAAIVRTILRDEALAHFDTSVEEQRENGENEEEPLVLTVDMVSVGLEAVSGAVFPHRALENQKLWMRRHLKKPSSMKYRLLQAKVLKMNKSLPLFPGGSDESKFSPREILEILEFSLPQTWRAKFDLNGYVPTNHDRKRLLQEVEALERNQPEEPSQKSKRKDKKGKETKNKSEQTKDSTKEGKKYCSEHGWGNHSSKECWKVHPELLPDKFKSANKEKPKGKESLAMSKATRANLLELLLTAEKPEGKKRKGGKTLKKSSKKVKIAAPPDSESDESIHNMDNTESDSSSSDMKERLQRYHQKLAQANQDNISDEE